MTTEYMQWQFHDLIRGELTSSNIDITLYDLIQIAFGIWYVMVNYLNLIFWRLIWDWIKWKSSSSWTNNRSNSGLTFCTLTSTTKTMLQWVSSFWYISIYYPFISLTFVTNCKLINSWKSEDVIHKRHYSSLFDS